MQYCGFVIEYLLNGKPHFEGPYSTIETTNKHYEDLALLEPAVSERRIYRLVSLPQPYIG